MKALCDDGNVLCLDRVRVNVQVVILVYSFTRCYL